MNTSALVEEISFPADDDDGDVDNPAISWRDLPRHRWFLVEGKRDVMTKWGCSKLLDLKSANGERFTVWATSLIKRSIDSKWDNRKAGAKLFITSLGERRSALGPYNYYDFKYKTIA